jgi:diadenosine tetraphosphate (Ap4A) HIT family hydrolase
MSDPVVPGVAARRFPDVSILDPAHCLICATERADAAAVVFRDDLWACEIVDGFEVPGWFFLRARRHALGWPELSADELESFGTRTRDIIGAIGGVTGARATYLMNFGEAYPHFHCVITARGDDVPPEFRSGNILQLRRDRVDRAAALALVPAVRAAYERAVSA